MATQAFKDPLDDDALVTQLGGTPKPKPFGGASNEDVLKTAYQQYTGRDADASGLAAHLKNPGGLQGGLQAIANSPEAVGYSRAGGTGYTPPAAAPAAGAPPTANTMPVRDGAGAVLADARTAATPTPVQPSVFQGFQPKYAMEGFDFNREQNTGKSAKDAFAYLSQQAPPPPIQDKAALGKWFDEHIAPGMNQLGHKVTGPAQGDKFGFENWQGKFDVDFGRGAGAEGGALAWQVDDPTAVLSNKAYTPQQATPADAALGAAIAGQGGESSARQKMLDEIAAMISGGATPTEADALAQQLR